MYQEAKVPGGKSSERKKFREEKVPGGKCTGRKMYQDQKFPEANVLGGKCTGRQRYQRDNSSFFQGRQKYREAEKPGRQKFLPGGKRPGAKIPQEAKVPRGKSSGRQKLPGHLGLSWHTFGY